MEFLTPLAQIVIVLYSIILHEVAHGAVANALGDPTAARAGRLTLNPISHIDPIGTILVPLIMAIVPGGVIFGWAKPVPYNPFNLHGRYDEVKVALAGPATNIVIAGLFSLMLRISSTGIFVFSEFVVGILVFGIVINVWLAFFNLVPIPPLDGSKLLFLFIPKENWRLRLTLERYGMMFLLFFIFFGVQFIHPLVNFVVRLFLIGL